MIEVLYVAVIVQLIVSAYLSWRVFDLTKEVEDTQVVVGSILYDMSQYEDDEEETRH